MVLKKQLGPIALLALLLALLRGVTRRRREQRRATQRNTKRLLESIRNWLEQFGWSGHSAPARLEGLESANRAVGEFGPGAASIPVSFPDCDGAVLRGVLYLPSKDQRPAPVVIMAHGFSLTYRQGLLPYAKACQQSGVAALAFDHRSFGESDGSPRGCVGWWRQVRGYKVALDYLERESRVEGALYGAIDSSRMAAWGFSFTSSMVLFLGAVDPRVSAVVAVAPGHVVDDDDEPASPDASELDALRKQYQQRTSDASERARLGKPMALVPGFGPWPQDEDGREVRMRAWFGPRIPDPLGDANAFFRRRGGPRSRWVNLARQVQEPMADVGVGIAHLHVPLLVVAARDDRTSTFSGAQALIAARPADAISKLHAVSVGGHFGLFDTPLIVEDADERGRREDAPAPHPGEVRCAVEATASFLHSAFETAALSRSC